MTMKKDEYVAALKAQLERDGVDPVNAGKMAIQNSDNLHVFPDGSVAVSVDGLVYSGARGLDVLAGRIIAGASVAERGGARSPQDRATARAAKIGTGDYSI
jgi:hypothetical protein